MRAEERCADVDVARLSRTVTAAIVVSGDEVESADLASRLPARTGAAPPVGSG
jgi:hypothetical protein